MSVVVVMLLSHDFVCLNLIPISLLLFFGQLVLIIIVIIIIIIIINKLRYGWFRMSSTMLWHIWRVSATMAVELLTTGIDGLS